MFDHLADWLKYLESMSIPNDSKTFLEYAKQIIKKLNIAKPDCFTVAVTGTNGKGSVVHCLEALALEHGLRVAAMTSPHLIKANERIRINQAPINDLEFCDALNRIHAALEGKEFTYFHYITLAALLIINDLDLDIALLEVGVGGRLDILSLIDNDLAVITNVSYDHCDLLGYDRENIAKEKAALIKPEKMVVVGDKNPPDALLDSVYSKQARAYFNDKQFSISENSQCWQYHFKKTYLTCSPHMQLMPENLAVSLTVFCLSFPNLISSMSLNKTLKNLVLPGRCQVLKTHCTWLLDVAHNEQSAQALAHKLIGWQSRYHHVYAIFGVKNTKSISAIISPFQSLVTDWSLIELPIKTTASFYQLEQIFRQNSITCYHNRENLTEAYREVAQQANSQDLVVVFGSFITVGGVLSLLQKQRE